MTLPGKSTLRRWGTFCFLVGVLLMAGRRLSEQASAGREARRLMAQLQQPGDEARLEVLTTLAQADLATRTRFLREFLSSGNAAGTFEFARHGFAVALSHVNADDAGVLFRKAVVPAMAASPDPAAIRAGLALMEQWSIAEALDAGERSDLAKQWAARLELAPNSATAEGLAAAVESLARELSPVDAAAIVKALIRPLLHPTREDLRIALVPAIRGLSERLDPEAAESLVDDVAKTLAEIHEPSAIEVLIGATQVRYSMSVLPKPRRWYSALMAD